MKKILFFDSCLKSFVVGILFFAESYGQSASATWALTVDTTVIISGSISAPGQVLSTSSDTTQTMTIKDFTGGGAYNPAERLYLNGTYWPQETAQNDGRFVQFSISPQSGKALTIRSVAMNLGCYGTNGHFLANIYYSLDSTFAARTKLNASALTVVDIRTTPPAPLSYTLSTVVNDEQTFYVRIYPWYNTTPSATKYICPSQVVISGTTASIGLPSISVFPTQLAFGGVKVGASSEKSYTLSGTLLNPVSDTITVTAPSGFSLTTLSGSAYASSLKLAYTGGILSDTTIYVKFSPGQEIAYSDTIRNNLGGATAGVVGVSGNGLPAAAISGIYVSTTGSDTSAGTYAQPFLTILKAISTAQLGDTIFVRGGRYMLSTTIGISKSGTSTQRYCLHTYQNERPILDFSGMAVSSSNRGIQLSGNYWYFKGFDIYSAGDNGMNISGSNNIIEFCALYENHDSGLQLGGGASYNQIINCDSYYNADPSQGNADGFSPKLDVGTGNSFYGCRSWQNSDDGYDGYLRPSNNITTTYENCWAFMNGYLKNWTVGAGNGNGFKTGGSDDKTLMHNVVLKKCLSFDNLVKGFDENNNRGSMTLYNCTAFRNNPNFGMPGPVNTDSDKVMTLINCIDYSGISSSVIMSTAVQTTNSWQGFYVTADDFAASSGLDTSGVRGPRNEDGSLPVLNFMRLNSESDLVNHGTNVRLPFIGQQPDLGCYETIVTDTAGFSVSTQSLNFDSVYVGDFRDDSIAVTNTGTLPLNIDIVISTNPKFSAVPTYGIAGVGSTMWIHIKFSPSAVGTQIGKIILHHNASNLQDTIIVNGVGGLVPVPIFSITPRTLNFGSIAIGDSKKDSVLVANPGTATLQINTIASTNARFTFHPLTMTLAPSISAYLILTFSPQDTVNQIDTLVLTHNAATVQDTIFLSGRGEVLVNVDSVIYAPIRYMLTQNYPNPFNPSTTLQFTVAKKGMATVDVLNVLGQDIAQLFSGRMEPGQLYSIRFDASRFPSGIYFAVFQSGGQRFVKKMVFIK
ncbi:MAG: choice-of-anchor D domain-containing protein [Ignavibacteriales bacterium]|nr:choice-of-anchor D domain-containing protein [Ignavibacteriales bacterium]